MVLKKIKSDKAHATFSASGSERWMNCPGSIALSKDAPTPPESIYAIEGTEAHTCLEILLKNGTTLERLRRTAEMLRRKHPKTMVDHAFSAARWVLEKHRASVGAELLCETRVDSSSFTTVEQFGTVDAAIVEEFGTLTVIDFKYGAGIVVDPAGKDGLGNSQLVYYALGISAAYHHNFTDVELVVIQPRATDEDGETIRTFKMSMDDLLAWVPRFQIAVLSCIAATDRYAINGVSSLVDGDWLKEGSWCRFCPAAGTCPELESKALSEAQIVFGQRGEIQSVPEPLMLPARDLGPMLAACEKLELWIEKVRAHAFHVLQRGEKVTGYKLVEKRAQRKWVDEKRIEDEAWARFGEAAFTDVKLLSPAQIERLDLPYEDKEDLQKWVRRRTVKESSGRTIAKESDRRLSVDPIASVFTVIDVDCQEPQTRKRRDGKEKRLNRK